MRNLAVEKEAAEFDDRAAAARFGDIRGYRNGSPDKLVAEAESLKRGKRPHLPNYASGDLGGDGVH